MNARTKDNCLRAIYRIKETYCKPCGLAICPHNCIWYEHMLKLRNGSGDNPLELETHVIINTKLSDRVIERHIAERLIEQDPKRWECIRGRLEND